jgi:hypothetical protein
MFRDEDCGLPGDYLVASTDTAKPLASTGMRREQTVSP